jgi:pimeloyl-ACP methyl ester carboxylesterase
MDLRGHGDSDATFAEYGEAAAGDDALSIVVELGGPAVLVGNSIGAGAAAYAAFERPDIIAEIALIGPIVRRVRTNPFKAWALRTLMCGPWAPAFWHSYVPSLYPGRKPDLDEHRAAIRESMRRAGGFRVRVPGGAQQPLPDLRKRGSGRGFFVPRQVSPSHCHSV